MNKDSDAVERYYSSLPENRLNRVKKIRNSLLETCIGVKETFKYKMPTFEKDGNWVALANNKNYISVYFCSEDLILNIKKRYPELDTGKGCVRIKDNNKLPIDELKNSFKKL